MGLHDLHDAAVVGIGLVDGPFAGRPDADDKGDCHAGAQAEDVDKGITAVLAELADGNEEIVFEHGPGFRIQQNRSQNSTRFLRLNNQLVAIRLI